MGGFVFCPNTVLADKINGKSTSSQTDVYIKSVYNKLNFNGKRKLKYQVFHKAFYGYLNMLEANKLSNRRYLSICDFSLSSNTNRLWVIDVIAKRVVYNTLVAHGTATGEEFATRFSNIPESHQSSLGFFVTAQSYSGHNGYSLRLSGVDGAYNNKAMSRDIVIHGADYVSRAFIKGNKRLGRSWGCPAVEHRMAGPIIDRIKNGSCLFIYHPTKSYLKSSYWLNNPVRRLPREAKRYNFKTNPNAQNEPALLPGAEEQAVNEEFQEVAPVEEPVDSTVSVVYYSDPTHIAEAKKDKNINVVEIAIPKDQVTPAMKKVAEQRIKTIRKYQKIKKSDKKDKKKDATIVEIKN